MKHPLSEMLHVTEREAALLLHGLQRLREYTEHAIRVLRAGEGAETEGAADALADEVEEMGTLGSKVATILDYYANEKEG